MLKKVCLSMILVLFGLSSTAVLACNCKAGKSSTSSKSVKAPKKSKNQSKTTDADASTDAAVDASSN
ncbi:MAG: hypothetical protein Q8R83_00060 [Legionellaceae bacterium]|nr:hypothetical protein [Legionellaceae bacterium]